MLKSRPYIHLHFLVFLWGFTAILGLLIELSFPEVVFYRTLISFIAFIPVLYFAKVSFKVEPKVVIGLIFTGIIISFHWLLFFGAARYANASVSLIGLATTSLWTSLLEPLARKRRISKLEVLFGLVIIIGIYIIYIDDFSYGLGLIMSIASAFFGRTWPAGNRADRNRRRDKGPVTAGESFAIGFAIHKFQRCRVNTITLAGRRRSIRENMPKVRLAVRAQQFDTVHAVSFIRSLNYFRSI